MKSLQIKFILMFGAFTLVFMVGDLALLQEYTGLRAGVPNGFEFYLYAISRMFPAFIFAALLDKKSG